MKRTILATILLFLIAIPILAVAQTIVENPAKPDNPRAGRIVTLEEVMRIEDTGKDFYIKAVYGLAIGSDGSVFVQDEQKQLLQFDPQGRFVRNLMKNGQGPGELTGIWDFIVKDRQVFLLGNPPKLLIFDFTGIVLNEVGLQNIVRVPNKMISSTAQGFLMYRRGQADPQAGTGWQNIPQEIVALSTKGGNPEVIESFSTPAHVEFIPTGGTRVQSFISLLFAVIDDRFLALSHTPEYLVKVFDTKNRKVTAAFKRPYKRINRPDGGGGVSTTGGSSYTPPKYLNDISRIHSVGGQIWIQTSAVDVKRGILFDVYNPEGHYLDCFFLKYKEGELNSYASLKRFFFSGGYVYFDDRTEDDLVVIRKCRLVGL
jgi:hypothetical protein